LAKEKDEKEPEVVQRLPDQNKPKTFSELLGGGGFYSYLPRIDFKELIDRQVLVIDVQILEDFHSIDYGVHDALLMLVEMPEDGMQYTTITSGEVVIKRVMKALKEGLLPLYGTITKGNYYNIL